jgi:hypothetical protein
MQAITATRSVLSKMTRQRHRFPPMSAVQVCRWCMVLDQRAQSLDHLFHRHATVTLTQDAQKMMTSPDPHELRPYLLHSICPTAVCSNG